MIRFILLRHGRSCSSFVIVAVETESLSLNVPLPLIVLEEGIFMLVIRSGLKSNDQNAMDMVQEFVRRTLQREP